MPYKRQPLSSWRSNSLSWSTEFNDLRNPGSLGKSRADQELTIRRELKRQGIFQDCTLIRDSDVVNHLALLKLIKDDEDKLQIGLSQGLFVIALRPEAESLTEVNEKANIRRAYPSRYEQSKSLVKYVDLLLESRNILLAEVSRPRSADIFRELLGRIQNSSHLSESENRLLELAIQQAPSNSGAEFLRFGDLYSYLVRKRRISPQSNLVQWCRAAHVLTIPFELSIAPSSSNQDLSSTRVGFILGHGDKGVINTSPWLDLFPRRILTNEALDRLSFKDIVSIRSLGIKVGYFDAVTTLQGAIGSAKFGKSFVSYLEILEEYLQAMSLEAKLELVDWQASLARDAVAIQDLKEKGLSFSIPVILATAYSWITQSPFPIDEAAASGVALELLRRFHRVRNPGPLSRLLSGITVTPPITKLN